jgi:ATP-binding cassette subfamily C protein CydCD
VRPLDPRLLRYAHAARRYLAVSVVVGTVTALVVVAQAWLISTLVDAGFVKGDGVAELRAPLISLGVVLVLRAGLLWATETAAQRSSAQAKSELRMRMLHRVLEDGSAVEGRSSTGDLTTLATRGVDSLDGYFARYLPQLVLCVVVPSVVLLALLWSDLVAALIVGVTIPLIPLFMALIGMGTQARTSRQLATLQRLSGQFLDVVAGLPTLKIFGRAKDQARAIRAVADDYRRTTMSTLRLAFVSSLVLELLAMLSVALVAVYVGLRLLDGHLDFRTALFVLLLAPEAYAPLRNVGASFHASAEGLAAVQQVFALIETETSAAGRRTDLPDVATSVLEVCDLTVSFEGRGDPVLRDVSLRLEPGTTVALTGPSGVGKSTLLAVLLGFVRPQVGAVRCGGVDVADLDPDVWRSQIAWVPQRPHLFAGTIADNVRLGRPEASDAAVDEALARAGLSSLVRGLPGGTGAIVGENGVGLSAGERQRLALARAFLRDAPLLLLDEPTAALDGETEADVLAAVTRLAEGRTVLLVAHRPALAAIADRVIALQPVPSLTPVAVP